MAIIQQIDNRVRLCYMGIMMPWIEGRVLRSKPAISEPGPAASVTARLTTHARITVRQKGTITPAKVTVTRAAASKSPWQAGMFKGISDVRGYVDVARPKWHETRRGSSEKAEKSEKRPWQPGMSKEVKSLRGCVPGGGSDSWDL